MAAAKVGASLLVSALAKPVPFPRGQNVYRRSVKKVGALLASRKLVMVTNDDSVRSIGMIQLAQALSRYCDVIIVAPETPQSATALSLTFHKPLRVSRVDSNGIKTFAVSGSPGDCVMIGVNRLLPRKPDLVASGVNLGDNNSYQDVLASGTVAAALEAAITGIPAIAFSMEVADEELANLQLGRVDFTKATEFAAEIVRDVLEHGMPSGAELLNVNFPSKLDSQTQIELTTLARRKYTDRVIVRKDPHHRPYYWLFGERLSEFQANTDVQAVLADRKISVTPLSLNMSGPISGSLEELRERVQRRMRRPKKEHQASHADVVGRGARRG
jgi:5'-nucleotidase